MHGVCVKIGERMKKTNSASPLLCDRVTSCVVLVTDEFTLLCENFINAHQT